MNGLAEKGAWRIRDDMCSNVRDCECHHQRTFGRCYSYWDKCRAEGTKMGIVMCTPDSVKDFLERKSMPGYCIEDWRIGEV